MIHRNNIKPCRRALKIAVACLFLFSLVIISLRTHVVRPIIVKLSPGVTAAQVQEALDLLPAGGGKILLPPGEIVVDQPIILRRNNESLCGSGMETILYLANNANCPVIVMGQPVNNPKPTSHLSVSNLFIDGNRVHQHWETWQASGDVSEIRNNGITVQNVRDSVIEEVACAHCRSGGLVSTLGTRRLIVRDFNSFDNQYDGLACYQTEDSLFTKLYLHDNPGAGISLDDNFNHNIIKDAVLSQNNLGIFMRWSDDNHFDHISIYDCGDYGVFMAQAAERTRRGAEIIPQSACVNNSFTAINAEKCGAAVFRVNDATCTNNVVAGAQFAEDTHGEYSMVEPNLLTMK
jgi:hypothetical protein